MSRYKIEARTSALLIRIASVIAMISVAIVGTGYAQGKDAKDEAAAKSHVRQQAREAAQPDTWAELDKRGRDMVAFDRIRK